MSVERSKWYQGFCEPGTREAREGHGRVLIQTYDARGFGLHLVAPAQQIHA